MKLQKFGAKNATADSCFGLIGPRQCGAALGGPATSTEDLWHQGALNKPGVLKHFTHSLQETHKSQCCQNFPAIIIWHSSYIVWGQN